MNTVLSHNRRLCHPTAYLDVAKVVASMTVKTSVHQHSIQNIDNWLSIGLRHIGPNIKVLGIFYILQVNGKKRQFCHFWRHRYPMLSATGITPEDGAWGRDSQDLQLLTPETSCMEQEGPEEAPLFWFAINKEGSILQTFNNCNKSNSYRHYS